MNTGGELTRRKDRTEYEQKYLSEGEIKLRQVESLKKDFNDLDFNGNGQIDSEELTRVLSSVGLDLHLDVVEEIMRVVDTNGDGDIDLNEFIVWNLNNADKICDKDVVASTLDHDHVGEDHTVGNFMRL